MTMVFGGAVDGFVMVVLKQKVDDGEHVGGRRLIDDCRVVVVEHQTTGYGGRRTEQGRWLVA
jgi:hypothetical protein